jgi:hypothetical protein
VWLHHLARAIDFKALLGSLVRFQLWHVGCLTPRSPQEAGSPAEV